VTDDGSSSAVQLVTKVLIVLLSEKFTNEIVNGISKYRYLGMVLGQIMINMHMECKTDSVGSNYNKYVEFCVALKKV
jgi:hypothetical protein